MRNPSFASISILGITLLFGALPSQAQTPPAVKAPAKVCALLPTADLETHFGAKAGTPRGNDATPISICAVDIPDRQHGANVMTNATGSPEMTVEQRLAAMRKVLDANGAEVKNFGTVGCFTGKLDLGTSKVPTVSCFLDKDGYISLSLWSDDAKQLSFEDAKTLLEKAAAHRP